MRLKIWILLAAMLGGHGVAMAQGGAHAARLRCELLDTPLAIEQARPSLSWEVVSGRRAERQTAYRVLVASSREKLATQDADLWDSGKVASRETSHVEYAGRALGSRRVCWWAVQLWDADGHAGEWSEPARWEMGLLDQADWTSSWIEAPAVPGEFRVTSAVYGPGDLPTAADGADVTATVAGLFERGTEFTVNNDTLGGDPAYGQRKRVVVWGELSGRPVRIEEPEGSVCRRPTGAIPYLRRSFEVRGEIVRARLHATALGVYELSLDGKKVGNQSLAPGWTDYPTRVRYQIYDVTDRLTPGAHTLGAVVAPGWFAGHAGLFGLYNYYGDTPALRAQLEIEYADGSTQVVATDDAWRAHASPWSWADLFDGEVYDARAAIDGWDTPGFDDSGWARATTREESRNLEADVCQPVRTLAELPAIALTEPSPGRWTFDLGQNMVGVVRLKLDMPAGTVVTMRHGEMLNPDGTIYTANLRGAPSTDVYVCKGGGVEEWRPRFTFHGFRYVELTGLPSRPPLDAVTGVVLGTDTPIVGSFECSDPRVNQLQSNIVWGMRGNYLSVPTDCPQRDERMGWMGDAQVFLPTALYNVDAAPFMHKWMADVRDAQRADGAFADVSPVTTGLSFGTPAWADAGVIVPWEVYRATGDPRVLERSIDSMVAWVEWCRAHSDGLIRSRDRGNDYGDWLSIDADTPKDVIGTAYFAHSTDVVARSLDALGRDEEAEEYHDLFAKIRAAFNDRYVRSDGRIAGDTQTVYVLALRFGLLDQTQQRLAVDRLVADIESKGWRLSTGFVGVSHLLHVLDDNGRADVAEKLLLQDEFPSWLFSVKHGATTIWERWNGWTPQTGPHPDIGMNSFNHYSLGSCGRWLYEGVGGIRPLEPGWGRVEIRPSELETLRWAVATHHSIRGEVSCMWKRDDLAFTMDVTIPANVEGVVYLPTADALFATESGGPVETAEGVASVGVEGGRLKVNVGSGTYRFRVGRAP